jgi:predicted permease
MANAQMKLAADEFRRLYPGGLGPQNGFGVDVLQDVVVRDVRSSLLVLVGAVTFVLLIACANVANLLLVRATVRRREIAVRSAIGAGRRRIVRQLLTESVLLSLVAGLFGIVVGVAGIRLLLSFNPGNIPRIGPNGVAVTVDWRVVGFTMGLSVMTGVVFGLFPALHSSRADLNSSLKESASRSGSGFRQHKARSLLVVSEVALALVLLVGAALLIRTFLALRHVDPGFDARQVLTMRMSLSGPRFEKTAAVAQLVRDGVDRIGAIPGVVSAGATCCVPLEGGYGLPFIIVGRPLEGLSHGVAGWLNISPAFFDVFRIPLIRGRTFTDRDDGTAPPVVIINQAMARQMWPKGDALNDRLVIGKGTGPEFDDPPRQIIGIVADTRDDALNRDPRSLMYVPNGQVPNGMNALSVRITPLAWVLRTRSAPYAVSTAAQEALRQASGGLPVARIRSMEEVVARSTARSDFNMLVLTVFGGVALLLAAIGIYGLMAYSVEQRTQEIGIRRALGAESSEVRNMVVVQGLRLSLAGVVIGIASAFGVTRVIASLLFGVTARDPIVFTMVPIVLTGVALVAVWLPARRATRIDPIVALRYE